MPYYHVTNKEILQALQEAQKQLNNQRKIFRSVLAELQCEKGYLTNGGLHGVVAKDRKSFDERWGPQAWCMLDSRKYSRNVIRPSKSAREGKEARSLFFSVPKVDLKPYIDSLKVPFPLFNDKSNDALLHPGFQKVGERFVISLPDWAMGLAKFPEGVTEVTHKQVEDWKAEE